MLGIAGTALLIFMRWFDLWLIANKDTERTGSALKASLNPDAWLEKSLFMILPMVLNALVLCPIVIKRALNAKRDPAESGKATLALAIASLLAIATLIYLVLVFTHQS